MGICSKWLFDLIRFEWEWKYRVSERPAWTKRCTRKSGRTSQVENKTGAYRKFACTLYAGSSGGNRISLPVSSRSHL